MCLIYAKRHLGTKVLISNIYIYAILNVKFKPSLCWTKYEVAQSV
jgi:hypothetical protein